MTASAYSNNSHNNNNSHHRRDNDRRDNDRRDHDRRDNDRRDHRNHSISSWKAKRIAQHVFPRKQIVRVDLRWDRGTKEYQVKFRDGSRVDVRARDGRVTYVHNNSHRHHRVRNTHYSHRY